ncbi:MAG TPA: aldehyde ferredoxin oxidoreductase family protein [Clostridiaceae bacterium]|nr:aldehyde ferredoxin oxidoreductase family protein [Clostridiaceae bacterium]
MKNRMSKSTGSFNGKLIRVDLTTQRITIEDCSDAMTDWLGGSGYAAKLLFDELPAWVTPYDPRNLIIISAGALIGTPAPGACKMSISTIGPVTGGWATGSSDSHLGVELKQAGYDFIILEGRSTRPVYLYINNDVIEIRSADVLWGLDTWETIDKLNELHGESLHSLVIGPAGENMSRGACVLQGKYRAFGRCGTGAVFGSKLLKAVVCKGSGYVHVNNPSAFLHKVSECRSRIMNSDTFREMGRLGTVNSYRQRQKIGAVAYKNFQGYQLPDDLFESIDPEPIIKKYQISRSGFPGCPISCNRIIHFTDGEYSGLTSMMSPYEIVGGIMSKLAIADSHYQVKVFTECNRMGLDVDMVGGAIAWAMECWQRGILTEDDTEGLELTWGDKNVVSKLIKQIAYREGFGSILTEGSAKAAELIGRGSDYYAMHIKGQDLYEMMRSSTGLCLGVAVSTRGGTHTTGAPCIEQSSIRVSDDEAQRIFGLSAYQVQNPDTYDGKAEMIVYYEQLTRAINSLGICLFNTVWLDMNFMNLDDITELINQGVGLTLTTDELKEMTMKLIDMEKAINIKFAGFDRTDDMPTPRDITEAVPDGPRKGWKLDMNQYNLMLDRYYELHGWDTVSGLPTRETLIRRGLDNVLEFMETKFKE